MRARFWRRGRTRSRRKFTPFGGRRDLQWQAGSQSRHPDDTKEGSNVELSVIQSTDQLTHISLSGRLDAVGVQKVATRFQGLTASRGKPTIIDMTNVEFIASLGLGMLLSCARALHGRGARTVILNPQPLVAKAIETAHMNSVIPVVRSIEEAEAALQ
jgi:anti-anti-sigma factor